MARREHQMPNVHRSSGKRPYFYIRYRMRILVGENFERKEKQQFLGYCNEMSKREAERKRDAIIAKVNEQVYTIQNQIRFSDFIKVYRRDYLVTLAPGGRKRESMLKNHIAPELGDRRMCDIGTHQVQQFLNAKEEFGLSWWTRKGLKSVLSSLFTKAVDWGYWHAENPVTKTRLGRKRAKRQKQILSDEQFQELLKELPPQIVIMVKTAATTGMRISELLGLRWSSVDLAKGWARVERRYYRGELDEPKTEGSKRFVPLGLLRDELSRMRPESSRDEDLVFNQDGKPLDDRAILRNCLRPAAKRLGIYFEGFGWHTFRRTNLTVMQEEGATVYEAQAQAGHSKPAMTWEYTVIGLDRREQAVIRVQQRLFGPAKPTQAA